MRAFNSIGVPIIDPKRPEEHFETVLPDMARMLESLKLRHGVNNVNMLVLMQVAVAGGTQQLGIDGVSYIGCAIDAWRFASKVFVPPPSNPGEPPAAEEPSSGEPH